jgi:hypothetical protein
MKKEPFRRLWTEAVLLALTEGTTLPLVRFRGSRQEPFSLVAAPGADAVAEGGAFMYINVETFASRTANQQARILIHELGHLFWPKIKEAEGLPMDYNFADWTYEVSGMKDEDKVYINVNQPPEAPDNSEGFWLAFKVYPREHHRAVGRRAIKGILTTTWTLSY